MKERKSRHNPGLRRLPNSSLPNIMEVPFNGEIITPQLLVAIRNAGQTGLSIQEKGVIATIKSTKEDLVTDGDVKLTEELKRSISHLFPTCAFMDEETEETYNIDMAEKDLVVVIDPIDGTTNFCKSSLEPDKSKRNENWGVSVGFVQKGELTAGIIYQPQTENMYYAEKGKGAYLNGERIQVSSTVLPQGAKLIYSSPYPKDKEAFMASKAAIARIEQEIPMQITNLGSQVIEAMQVAQGKQDSFMHLKTKPWDIAAASIIVTEAGGRCLDAQGNDYILFGDSILLVNGVMDIVPITTITSEILCTVSVRNGRQSVL